jgi:hypothetical protein
VAPQFGPMADVAMESEGKAAGGRVASAHLVLLVCVVFVCARVLQSMQSTIRTYRTIQYIFLLGHAK